jgi:ADP-ribose pyrophosphatase YjhB (NUDIX family)
MKSIATIYQKDVFPDMAEAPGVEYLDRNTGKAIVLDVDGNMALVGNSQNTVLQMPGGGIDEGEAIDEGVIRECREEIGCVVELKSEVGVVDDYRPRDKRHCISFCYTATVLGQKGTVSYTENEDSIGMYVVWIDPKKALNVFKKQEKDLRDGKIGFYNTGFNILRDLMFLKSAFERRLLK